MPGASPATPKDASLIRVSDINQSYGAHHTLKGVSFEVRKGEIFGIIGPSGAGKTTLLNVLVGFVIPSRGDVTIHAGGAKPFSVFREPHRVKHVFGFSTQEPSLYNKLTCWENLMHYGALYGIPRTQCEERATRLLKLVGLWNSRNRLGNALSGGMQKRLDIACALIHEPAILILDEPTADIDPILRQQLWGLIREINKHGTTILIASHFLGEVEQLCDRIGIVHGHAMDHVGTADELRALYTPYYEVVVRLEQEKDMPKLLSRLKRNRLVAKTVTTNAVVRLYTPAPETLLKIVASILKGHRLRFRDLRAFRPPMREVFEALVK